MTRHLDISLRFEAKINKLGPNDCWLWTGATTGRTARYKHGSIGLPRSRATAKASRVSWELAFGPIPEGACVLHKCDNPLCVNPEHLFLGTHAENMDDMRRKGRSTHGVKSARAKLSAEQVREIRNTPVSNKIMADRFGVANITVSQIRKGKGWPEVPLPGIEYPHHPRVQTPETRVKISASRLRLFAERKRVEE